MPGTISVAPRRNGIRVALQSDSLEPFWAAETVPDPYNTRAVPHYPALPAGHLAELPLADTYHGSMPTGQGLLRRKGSLEGLAETVPFNGSQPLNMAALNSWLSTATSMMSFVDGWQMSLPTVQRLRRVSQIGVELEGGWNDCAPFDAADAHGAEIKDDSSVTAEGYHISGGEIVSAPTAHMSGIESFMEDCYPDNVNRSCGLHVHVSFADVGDYALIMEPSFHGALLAHLNRWGRENLTRSTHRFWQRLQGSSTYCQPLPLGQAQNALDGALGRYVFVNFSAWRAHGTVEFRMLPMFNQPHTAIQAVRDLVTFVESYLRHVGTGTGTLSATV